MGVWFVSIAVDVQGEDLMDLAAADTSVKPSPIERARPTVLFVCVHNAGKSQIAAAIMRQGAGERVNVRSAGTAPDAQVHDLSASAVAELGADMSDQVPTRLEPEMLTDADRIIVLGSEARVEAVEGMRATIDTWVIPDPADQGIEGLDRVRLMRDDIAERVHDLLDEMGMTGGNPLQGQVANSSSRNEPARSTRKLST